MNWKEKVAAVLMCSVVLALGILAMPRTARPQTICDKVAVEVTCETPLNLKGMEFNWRKTVERSGDDIQVSGRTCIATVNFGTLKVTAYEFVTYFFCFSPNAGNVMGQKDGKLYVFSFQSRDEQHRIMASLLKNGIDKTREQFVAKSYPSKDYDTVYASLTSQGSCAVGK